MQKYMQTLPNVGHVIHMIYKIHNKEVAGFKVIKRWISIKNHSKINNQFNLQRAEEYDKNNHVISIRIFDGTYRWEYWPGKNKILKRKLIASKQEEYFPSELKDILPEEEIEKLFKYDINPIEKEPTDENEYNYWLSQEGAKLLGEKRVGKFNTHVVEIEYYSDSLPRTLEHISCMYFDKETYIVVKEENYDVGKTGKKHLTEKFEVVKYEIIDKSQVPDDFFTFKVPPHVEIIEEDISASSQRTVSKVVEQSPFPVYVLKDKPYNFNLFDISLQFNEETLEQFVSEIYVTPDINDNWFTEGDFISIEIGRNIEFTDDEPNISPKKQKVKLIDSNKIIDISVYFDNSSEVAFVKTVIDDVKINIQINKAALINLNEQKTINIIKRLTCLKVGNSLIENLELQRESTREKIGRMSMISSFQNTVKQKSEQSHFIEVAYPNEAWEKWNENKSTE